MERWAAGRYVDLGDGWSGGLQGAMLTYIVTSILFINMFLANVHDPLV